LPHPIPADKQLPADWIRSLFERGVPEPWTGPELQTIGMPVGGIGAGQLYLCGDGTLGNWEIFNHYDFVGWGDVNYKRRSIKVPVEHGFAVLVEREEGVEARRLRDTDFTDVSFRGEYPIGTVKYADPDCPLRVELEAFSPFIPLNARDSALPATVLHVTVENASDRPVRAGVMAWLENPLAREAGERKLRGHRRTRVLRTHRDTRIVHEAVSDEPEPTKPPPPRPPIPIVEFEGDDYGDWVPSGEAFGQGPVEGTLPFQGKVRGFDGKRVVNSFHGGDDPYGKLVSPAFLLSRRYLNFKIGGGEKPGLVGTRLLVDGEVVRSATGLNTEHLEWRFWNVEEFEGKEARLEIFDDASGGWGHVLFDRAELADEKKHSVYQPERFDEHADVGTVVLSCMAPCLDSAEAGRRFRTVSPRPAEIQFDDEHSGDLVTRTNTGLYTTPVTLRPHEKLTIPFLVAWHFPTTVKPDWKVGHVYAERFSDAGDVADYVLKNRDRLVGETRLWRDTYYDSTLPLWLLDRIHLTACCLATGTVQWWKNERFWAWEGVVCCEGTCTHVWNYAQTLARLFPELERNVRERQDFGEGFDAKTGLVGFRGNRDYAADGQCGTILKAWREHLVSPDDSFLRRNWPSIRKAVEFLLRKDENDDGLIENSQHNTYDINFQGANTFVGALYLAALRAAAEMALEMGETEYARDLGKRFETGSRLSVERLWNGEYFTQDVDLQKHPKDQYGPGCLSDQLFGQSWAHQVGLGYLYPGDKVRTALESVWRYNWAPDVGPYQKRFGIERPFAERTEAGLILCTWPKSDYLGHGVRYRNEVWTGIEYQVASHMIREGLVKEGLAICRAIHDRYHPRKRNPYNEIECSDFYARGMASWSVLLALCGFEYHGPKGRIGFAPRVRPENFRAPFTAAEGWGTFEQQYTKKGLNAAVSLRWGRLRVRELSLEIPESVSASATPRVRLGERSIDADAKLAGRRVTLQFHDDVVLQVGGRLDVTVEG